MVLFLPDLIHVKTMTVRDFDGIFRNFPDLNGRPLNICIHIRVGDKFESSPTHLDIISVIFSHLEHTRTCKRSQKVTPLCISFDPSNRTYRNIVKNSDKGFALALSAFLLNLDVNTAKNDVANLLTTDKTAMSHFPATNLIVANFVTKLDDPIVSAKNSIASDYPDVAKEMEDVIGAANQGLSVQEIVNKFGKACGLPGSFQGALGSLLLSQDYVSAVRNNILAGAEFEKAFSGMDSRSP